MFVTKNISKVDFEASRDELSRLGKGLGLKTKIVCLDLNGLIAMERALTTPDVYDTIVKEKDRFIDEFSTMLSTNHFVDDAVVTELVNKFQTPSTSDKIEPDTFTVDASD